MEVSSHGMDQGRVAGIKFDVAVFTNLTRDHLDYHGTMESYAEAKFKLFSARGLTHRVVNIDDNWGVALASRLGPDVITYGVTGKPHLRASRMGLSEAGVRFHVDSEWGDGEVHAAVLGAFNVSNLLAVMGALLAAGVSFDDAVAAVSSLKPVPGRLERLGEIVARLDEGRIARQRPLVTQHRLVVSALGQADVGVIVGRDRVRAIGARAHVVEMRCAIELTFRLGDGGGLEQVVDAGLVLVERKKALALEAG
jgi:hypothetical protein